MSRCPFGSEPTDTYLWEFAPSLVLRLNELGQITHLNAAAEQLLGREALGQDFRAYVLDFHQSLDWDVLLSDAGLEHPLSLSLPGRLPETWCFRFFKDQGVWVFGHLDTQEQARLGTEVLELNHELNNLSRQLHQANAELKELNDLKNQFLGMAAHDLRHPVSHILAFSGFLMDEVGPSLSVTHQEYLQICLDAAYSMKGLIDNFLDLAVIEAGALRLEAMWIPLSQVVRPLLPMIQRLAEKKNIRVLWEALEGDPSCFVDGPKLQQALYNLLKNAVEHTFEGGEVRLSAQYLFRGDRPAALEAAGLGNAKERGLYVPPAPRMACEQSPHAMPEGLNGYGAQRVDEGLLLAVADQGPGLTDENKAKLFKPFAQGGPRKTAKERSVGLGLSIASMIVRAHGGRIWAESEGGQGSVFKLWLPPGAKDQGVSP